REGQKLTTHGRLLSRAHIGVGDGPEDGDERGAQRSVGIGHRHGQAEIDEAGDAVAGDAARNDAGKMREIRLTLSAMPCRLTQRLSLMPIAAILSSAGCPSGSGGLSGRTTHTPTRSSRRSPLTLKLTSAPMIQASS